MTKFSHNAQGATLMVGCMAAFTINDTAMKALGNELPLFQAIGLRGILASVLILGGGILLGQHRLLLSKAARRLLFARSIIDVLATFLYLFALFNMPLAGVVSILQILPLSVTFAGAVFLKEPIGWRSSLAILVGFIGVLLVVKPGTDSFNAYSIYALIAVAAVTARDLISREMPDDIPSLYVGGISAFVVTICALIMSLFFGWKPISVQETGLLTLAAFFLTGGYVLAVAAMRVGSIAAVAPFRYSSLIIALILGYIFFQEWPDFWTWIGSGLMVSSGCFALWRKAQKSGPESVSFSNLHS